MSVTLTFLGAAGTVTGSKYLVEGGGKRILVDCGMFQGDRDWNDRNWANPDIDLPNIDAVLLTHAHIDHIGILPRYAAHGLHCPVYATLATRKLSQLLLLDSGRLQEEEAEFRQKPGRSRYSPPLPLYTEAQAAESLKLFRDVRFHKATEIFPGISATWNRMGHILGAGSITLEIGGRRIVFSGDIGRYTVPILKDPEPVKMGDLLLVESTYGDRNHDDTDPKILLEKVIYSAYQRRGIVLIPSFAVGRTQLLLFYIRELKEQGRIPDIPVIIDSPMADDATQLYTECTEDYDEHSIGILESGRKPFTTSKLRFIRSRTESIALNSINEPMILISASGMLTGGRILHHLFHRISNPDNTLLFVGFQPKGGRGSYIKSGAKSLTLFGKEVSIRAHVEEISGLSAHGDRRELLRWCKSCEGRPGKVSVVHGEPDAANAFAETLRRECSWNAQVAGYKQTIDV